MAGGYGVAARCAERVRRDESRLYVADIPCGRERLHGDRLTGGRLAAPRVRLRLTRGNGKLDPYGVPLLW